MREMDYSLLPEHLRGGIKRYVEDGVQPGHFLTAVICNDLFGAFARADITYRNALFDIISFFYNETPGNCWGSPEKMVLWMNRGGLKGIWRRAVPLHSRD